jgi:hypothetical protein
MQLERIYIYIYISFPEENVYSPARSVPPPTHLTSCTPTKSGLIGLHGMQFCGRIPSFRRKMLPPFSGFSQFSLSSMAKSIVCSTKEEFHFLPIPLAQIGLHSHTPLVNLRIHFPSSQPDPTHLSPVDGYSILVRKVCIRLQEFTVSQLKVLYSSLKICKLISMVRFMRQ